MGHFSNFKYIKTIKKFKINLKEINRVILNLYSFIIKEIKTITINNLKCKQSQKFKIKEKQYQIYFEL